MSYRQKKALEMAMRDAMDGMEQLASMMAFGHLPEDLEILEIGIEFELETPVVAKGVSAEIIQIDRFRASSTRLSPQGRTKTDAVSVGKNNKIRML